MDKLVLDEVPSVRFLVTTELFRLFTKTPTNFWRLAENVAQHEQNKVVQQALCRTLGYVVTSDEARTTEVLNILSNNPNFFNDDFDPRSPFISIVMWLAIVRENEWAIKTANLLLAQPTRFAKLLGNATFELLDKYVKPQNLDTSFEVIDKAIDWLNKAIDVSAKSIRELQSLPELKQDEKLQSEIRGLYNVPNEIVMRIYFNLDFREKQRDKGKEPISDEQRNEFYFKVKPLLKKILNTFSNKNNCIIPAYIAHHFMQLLNDILKYDPKDVLHMAADVVESSEPAGYNLDSISVSETVKLVEAVLADHRDEVQNDDSLHDLIIILDVFIESGWPDALRLVWRLDEIFR